MLCSPWAMHFGSMRVLCMLREMVELLSLEVFKECTDVALKDVVSWYCW